jgi:hypothetical protein
MIRTSLRGLAIATLIMVGVATALSAQSSQVQPAARSEMVDLLTEVRELRAELSRAATTSIRMQVLVARVTLQEQRITSLGRQISDVQSQLATAMKERLEVESQIKLLLPELSAPAGPIPEEVRKQTAGVENVLKTTLAQRLAREQQLRAQEAELTGFISNEQGRWTEFNIRLDELERSLATGR